MLANNETKVILHKFGFEKVRNKIKYFKAREKKGKTNDLKQYITMKKEARGNHT